jgi:hypothetical protein
MHAQGLDGVTLEVPNVFGSRALGTTPDYVFTDEDGNLVAWLDVKAVERAYSYPAQWTKAEAVIYTYALMRLNAGVLPAWCGYHEYRRNAKPYWMLTTTEDLSAAWLQLAEHYVRRWNTALQVNDVNALQFNPKACGKCPFRLPIAEADYAGCPVGQSVVQVSPVTEEGAV